jgi:hypothetical protein
MAGAITRLGLSGQDARQGTLSPPGSQGHRSPQARWHRRRRRGRLGFLGRERSVRVAREVGEDLMNTMAGSGLGEWD